MKDPGEGVEGRVQVRRSVSGFQVVKGVRGEDVGDFVNSVFCWVDERAFDVGAEGFGAIFCDAEGS